MKTWIDKLASPAETVTVGTKLCTVINEGRDNLHKEDAGALSECEYAEYQRVAAKVGFAPRGLESEALRRFLCDAGIRVYPYQVVQKYLNDKYGVSSETSGAKWVWKPLRGADQVKHDVGYHQYIRRSLNGAVAREQPPYAKPVPLPVLLTVERITERFPEALFFVSDQYSAPPIPDPFLCVVYGEDPEPVVIERWDEPKFRG